MRERTKKWTFETIGGVAKDYNSRVSFARGNPAAYRAARRNLTEAEFDKICAHMTVVNATKPVIWTLEAVLKSAKSYSSFKEFSRNETSAYQKVMKMGWKPKLRDTLGEGWFESSSTSYISYTYDDVCAIAKKYEIKSEFRKNDKQAYTKAQNEGWISDICAHMKQNRKWTNSLLVEEAKKYKSYADFTNLSPSAQITAFKRGIIDTHIKPIWD